MQMSKIYITPSKVIGTSGQKPVNITFDCVMNYSPVYKRSISSYPVSTKANLGEHIFSENTTLNLTGMITATPLFEDDKESMIKGEKGLSRVQRAYTELLNLHRSDTPLTLVSEFDVIPNVYLVSVSPNQDSNAMIFTLGFEQQKFASYKGVLLVKNISPSLSSDAATTTSGNDPKGEGYDKEDPTGTKKINASDSTTEGLSKMFDNVGVIFDDYSTRMAADVKPSKLEG